MWRILNEFYTAEPLLLYICTRFVVKKPGKYHSRSLAPYPIPGVVFRGPGHSDRESRWLDKYWDGRTDIGMVDQNGI